MEASHTKNTAETTHDIETATPSIQGPFIQIEELKASEMAIHPMALKKQGDQSMLREMLMDAETRCSGMTKSTYRVLFMQEINGKKLALKIFPRGKN